MQLHIYKYVKDFFVQTLYFRPLALHSWGSDIAFPAHEPHCALFVNKYRYGTFTQLCKLLALATEITLYTIHLSGWILAGDNINT